MTKLDYYTHFPSQNGKYGSFGGRFVPETLMPALLELESAYLHYKNDPVFLHELNTIRSQYTGRPTSLYYASHLSAKYSRKIYLKREDLLHGGAHKINNTMGQALLAKKMGKKNLIAETGAGQHGVATAIAGAYFGMPTKVFMGEVDMVRQSHNVQRMQMLGAEVIPVKCGSRTLKDACSETLRYWTSTVDDTYYIIGSVVGPHPYPMMVRDFQSVIGNEIRQQIITQEGRLPNAIVACVGGGSNAMGSFYAFIEDEAVELFAVEAGGLGTEDHHAQAMAKGKEGIFQGARQFLLQDANRNIKEAYSIAAGLDYPGKGPEICYLRSIHRIQLGAATDNEAIQSCFELSRSEGIIPALESSHAIAFGIRLSQTLPKDAILVITVSGAGGKDIERIVEKMEEI
jgi:tryptophan synthase beta chain